MFQKSFVEFFVKESVVEDLEKRAEKEGGLVTFYAGNRKVCFLSPSRVASRVVADIEISSHSQGDFRTNMQPADVNAVTWAIFPGQEVVQSTIIEEVSFLSWKVRLCPSFLNLYLFHKGECLRFFIISSFVLVRLIGGSLLDLARLGIPIPSSIADSQAARRNSGRLLARQCRASRLQESRWSREVPVGLEGDLIFMNRSSTRRLPGCVCA